MQRDELEADLAEALTTLIDQGYRRIAARLDLTRVQVLGLVATAGPIRPAAVAERLHLTKSTVSRQLTALQDAGQVQVTGDPGDGRTFLVGITAEGQHEVTKTRAAGTSKIAAAIAHWSNPEVDEARRAVRRLLAAWDTPEAPDRMPLNTGEGVVEPRWMRRRLAHRPTSTDQEEP